MGEIFKLFGSIGVDTSEAEKGIDDVTGKAKKSGKGIFDVFTKAAKGIGKIAAGIGVFALVNKGIGMITSSVGGAIKRIDTMRNSSKVFENLGFEAEVVDKVVQNLGDSLDGLPTALNDAIQHVQGLGIAHGDLDKAQQIYTSMNNAVLGFGGDAQSVDSVMVALTRSINNNSMAGDQWNTINEQAVGLLPKMAEAMGYTTEQLKEGLSDGSIAMKDFEDTLIDMNENGSDSLASFETMARDMTGGISTSIANMRTAVVRGVGKVIEKFDEAMSNNGLPTLSEIAQSTGKTMEKWLGKAADAIGPLITGFANLLEKVKNSTAWKTLREVIFRAVEAIKDLWTSFDGNGILMTVKDMLVDLANALLEVDFNKVVDDVAKFLDKWSPLIAGIAAGIAAFKLITGAIALWSTVTGIATGVMGAFGAVLAFVTSPIGIIVIAIGALIAIGVLLYKNWETIKEKAIDVFEGIFNFIDDTLQKLWDAIFNFLEWFDNVTGGKFTDITDKIRTFINNFLFIFEEGFAFVKEFITNQFRFLKALFTGDFGAMKEIVVDQFNLIKDFLSNLLTNLIHLFDSSLDLVKSVFLKAFNWLNEKTNGKFGEIVGVIMRYMQMALDNIKAIWDYIKNTFINFGVFLKALVTGDFEGMKNAMKNQMDNALNLVKNILNNIKSFFSSVLGNTLSDVKTKFNNIKDAMLKPIQKARDMVKAAIDKMKSFFNFKWSLPKLKMPTFSVSGSANPLNWLKDGVPKLSVKWNAKGGIFNEPTIFSTARGLQGVGEVPGESEAILPLNKETLGGIGDGIAATMNWGNDQIIALLETIKDQIAELLSRNDTIILQIDGKAFAKITSDYTNAEGGIRIRRIERGLA